MSGDDLAAGEFRCYLVRLATGAGHAGREVVIPNSPRSLQLDELDAALADPRSVLPRVPDGQVVRPSRVIDRLFQLAVWLRYAPPDTVPPELASRAARLRFLVWTLPVRLGWPRELVDVKVQWTLASEPRHDDYIVASREVVLAEARAARADWLAHLDSWEDDPWLTGRHEADPTWFEAELRWLVVSWPHSRADHEQTWSGPIGKLDLSPMDAGPAERDQVYLQAAVDLVEQHWLSRGSLRQASATLFPDDRRRRWAPWLIPAMALVIVAVFLLGYPDLARWAALGGYTVGILGIGVGSPRLITLALLRIPAAVAVGEVVLLSLTPRWWLAPNGWLLGVGIIVFAVGYLVMEARMHGAPRGLAYLRGTLVAAIGVLHAFVLSLVVLGFVAPAVAESGSCLDNWQPGTWWGGSPYGDRTLAGLPGSLGKTCGALADGPVPSLLKVLVLMTGWSLAVGLAAQILWDDRPVTAPLGRQRRVRGAR